MHETSFVIGCGMAGWIVIEFVGAIAKGKVDLQFNIFGFIAGCLIAFGSLR